LIHLITISKFFHKYNRLEFTAPLYYYKEFGSYIIKIFIQRYKYWPKYEFSSKQRENESNLQYLTISVGIEEEK